MEEELEVLDLQDLLEEHNSKDLEKMFTNKLHLGYKVSILIKRLFTIQIKKNQLFSKSHNPDNIVIYFHINLSRKLN
jgi:hypothetical protein